MESNKEEDLKKKFTADELNDLREWIDCIPLSRPKKNLARDFSDGVLVAEILAHFFPGKVNVKSFFMAHSKQNKAINWSHLNEKIFPQFGIRKFKESTLNKLMDAKPGLIEKVMYEIRAKLSEKIPTIAVKSQYKSNSKLAAKKKEERPRRSRLPMFSKIEMQIENEARAAAAKTGLGDCSNIIQSCGNNADYQITIDAIPLPVAEFEPQIYLDSSCLPKQELFEDAPCGNDVNENMPENILQAFDSSWFSYPISNDPILQVNVVDTSGLV